MRRTRIHEKNYLMNGQEIREENKRGERDETLKGAFLSLVIADNVVFR